MSPHSKTSQCHKGRRIRNKNNVACDVQSHTLFNVQQNRNSVRIIQRHCYMHRRLLMVKCALDIEATHIVRH